MLRDGPNFCTYRVSDSRGDDLGANHGLSHDCRADGCRYYFSANDGIANDGVANDGRAYGWRDYFSAKHARAYNSRPYYCFAYDCSADNCSADNCVAYGRDAAQRRSRVLGLVRQRWVLPRILRRCGVVLSGGLPGR